jgi:hypothetical protein
MFLTVGCTPLYPGESATRSQAIAKRLCSIETRRKDARIPIIEGLVVFHTRRDITILLWQNGNRL